MSLINLNDLKEKERARGFRGHIAHAVNLTIAYWDIEENTVLPEHTQTYKQITTILEGKFMLNLADETQILGAGSVVVIPPNVKHSGIALTPCRIMDTFFPVFKTHLD